MTSVRLGACRTRRRGKYGQLDRLRQTGRRSLAGVGVLQGRDDRHVELAIPRRAGQLDVRNGPGRFKPESQHQTILHRTCVGLLTEGRGDRGLDGSGVTQVAWRKAPPGCGRAQRESSNTDGLDVKAGACKQGCAAPSQVRNRPLRAADLRPAIRALSTTTGYSWLT